MRAGPYAPRASVSTRLAGVAALLCAALPAASLADEARTGGTAPSPARQAFVTNQTGDSLSVVDLATRKAVAEIEIGGKPAGIAIAPDGKTAYVTAPDSKSLVVIDTETREVTGRISLGEGPLGIAVHPDGKRVFVADWYEHKLYSVEPAAGRVTGSVDVGLSPSGVAVTPDGKTILTADRDSNEVSLIDAETFTRTRTVEVGTRPFGVTIDADGRRAYTANVKSDDVSVIDIALGKTVATVRVGSRPYAVALAGGRGFVTDQYGATVTVFDLATHEIEKAIDVGEFPEGIEADPTGKAVYVACWDANTLERIDTETLEVTDRIAVGNGPRAFGRFLR